MQDNKTIKRLKIVFFFVMFIMFVNIAYISVTGIHLVSNSNISNYAKDRDFKQTKIQARRGTIYDRNGNVIAEDKNTYNIVAFLNKDRIDIVKDIPGYVTDPAKYAKALAPILGEDEAKLLELLSKDPKKFYQTELGLKGKNLPLSTKEQIDALKLYGIEFETNTTRFYPNGIFASSTIGYAVYNDEEDRIQGMLGVEQTYDDILTGHDGYRKYVVDAEGFERKTLSEKAAVDGKDIYLNIDNTIQRLVETNMDDMLKNNPARSALVVVTDAKTNEILALSNRPTFNPNILDITDFNNPFVSFVFEPGSTMKAFSYASIMDMGSFPDNTYYNSGSIWINDNGINVQEINNYDRNNWGTITFEEGFMRSSNTAFVHLFNNYANVDTFGDYLDKFGFYQKTGIDMPNEASGTKVFSIKQEKITTAFGQASATTPVQLVQAFSAITNNGMMMQPYLTNRIYDPSNKKTQSFKPKEVRQVITPETSKKMLNLMTQVVEDPRGGAYLSYRNDDYTIAGKTGTAQVIENGAYLDCYSCTYNSFLMSAPADNPKINIYILTAFDETFTSKNRGEFIKNITSNILSYLDVAPNKSAGTIINQSKIIELESFYNKSISYTKNILDTNQMKYLVLGDGNNVVKQYPLPYNNVSSNQNIFILSDATSYQLPNLVGYSQSDVQRICSLLNIKVQFTGSGYAKTQSIPAGSVVNPEMVIDIKLE